MVDFSKSRAAAKECGVGQETEPKLRSVPGIRRPGRFLNNEFSKLLDNSAVVAA
jgi:hypothetical protein